jgi:hypothetical protein
MPRRLSADGELSELGGRKHIQILTAERTRSRISSIHVSDFCRARDKSLFPACKHGDGTICQARVSGSPWRLMSWHELRNTGVLLEYWYYSKRATVLSSTCCCHHCWTLEELCYDVGNAFQRSCTSRGRDHTSAEPS